MLDRTIAPSFKRSSSFNLLPSKKVLLPNGASLHFINGGAQEVIKVEVIVKGGRWYEETTGAAHFAATLLSKGTSKKSSFEIAKIFDSFGAHLEVTPGLDVVSVALYSLTKNIKPVLDLLLELLSDAVYPDKEIEQAKTIFLQNLRINKEKTSFQASKQIRRKLYSEAHPYGKDVEEADVEALTREAIEGHYKLHFNDVFVLVSGKISSDLENLVLDAFGKIKHVSSGAKAFKIEAKPPHREVISKEGSLQSSVRIGKRFIGRTHPDYFDVLMLNHLLGGYFGSRLMKNIREEKGFTYGIYASIHTLLNDNYLVIGADVNKENMQQTFDEVRKELKRLRSEKIEVDELQTGRNHFIGSLQAEITTPFSHADKHKNILLYALPEDYYIKLINRLDTLKPDDLLSVGEKYFHEDSFFEVAVG